MDAQPTSPAKQKLWRDLQGRWRYTVPTRDACITVKLSELDMEYLNRFPERIDRFILK